jgi:hypothetical protein
MPGPTIPVDLINEALGECGLDPIGDLDDGSAAANVALRIYDPTLRELHAGAPWNFARRQENMVLLADISGEQSVYTDVAAPWAYMYEWPIDCVHARWVPGNGTQTSITVPPIFSSTPNLIPSTPAWNYPTPFQVSSSDRPNDVATDWYLIEGHDPEHTKVVLSNMSGASLIYTGLMQYPDAWDALFRRAMVAALSARLAMPLIKDRKEARVIRGDNIAIARDALTAARVRDGDEGWTVADHTPDWIRARTGWNAYGMAGFIGCGWLPTTFDDAGGVY